MPLLPFEAKKISSVPEAPTTPGSLHQVTDADFIRKAKVAANAGRSCGYVAAALLQAYWHHRITPNKETPVDQKVLHDEVLACGFRQSSWAFSIRHAWRKALRTGKIAKVLPEVPTLRLRAQLSWAGVYKSLERNEPVLLFGGLPDVSRERHPYINHAVLAYGYLEEAGKKWLLVHYGWPGQEAWLLKTPFQGSALFCRVVS